MRQDACTPAWHLRAAPAASREGRCDPTGVGERLASSEEGFSVQAEALVPGSLQLGEAAAQAPGGLSWELGE